MNYLSLLQVLPLLCNLRMAQTRLTEFLRGESFPSERFPAEDAVHASQPRLVGKRELKLMAHKL